MSKRKKQPAPHRTESQPTERELALAAAIAAALQGEHDETPPRVHAHGPGGLTLFPGVALPTKVAEACLARLGEASSLTKTQHQPAASKSSPLEAGVVAALRENVRARADANDRAAKTPASKRHHMTAVYRQAARRLDEVQHFLDALEPGFFLHDVAAELRRREAAERAIVKKAKGYETDEVKTAQLVAGELQTLVYWLDSGEAVRSIASKLAGSEKKKPAKPRRAQR